MPVVTMEKLKVPIHATRPTDAEMQAEVNSALGSPLGA